MHLCYIDESGTPEKPGNTSHFILAGLSIPIEHWKTCEEDITRIKKRFQLSDDVELHTGWILRNYTEQNKISNFASLDYTKRRFEVEKYRVTELLRLQKLKRKEQYRQTKKNFAQTNHYIHLTRSERTDLIKTIARTVCNWRFARLFAECIDKIHFDPAMCGRSIDEQAFEQVVSRFEHFLQIIDHDVKNYGLLIHDNNLTISKKHTALMKKFHQSGTLWTKIENIIETPLFVDSQLTSMIQIIDLCAYALRRYLENNEEELFDLIFQRADKKDKRVVGVRHFTSSSCICKICTVHRQ